MAITTSVPLTKRFSLITESKDGENQMLREPVEGEQAEGYATFRQARGFENEQRQGLVKRRFAQDGLGMVVFDDSNDESINRVEVQLTLCGTDILGKNKDEEDFELEFTEVGFRATPKSEKQFNEWWGNLPIQWQRILHELCLKVNPDWDPKRAL
jgi:hypothetical protein